MKTENEIKLADQLDLFASKLKMHNENLKYERDNLIKYIAKYDKVRLDNIAKMAKENKRIAELEPTVCHNLLFNLNWHTLKLKREEWAIEIMEQICTQLCVINNEYFNGDVKPNSATTLGTDTRKLDIDEVAQQAKAMFKDINKIDIKKYYKPKK